MKKSFLIFIILSQVIFINAQLNGTYLIGANQPYPYNTLTNAVTNLNTVGVSGPVTFLLTDNLYQESGIEFITVAGTSTTNTITLRPANGVDATIQGDGDFVIGIDRTSHLIFEGKSTDNTGSLTITSTETTIGSSVIKYTTPYGFSGNILNICVKNCNINAAQAFFTMGDTISYGMNLGSYVHRDSITISGNTFTGGDYAIYVTDDNSTEIVNIINNRFNSSGGIACRYSGPSISNASIKIRDNIFANINLAYTVELSIIYCSFLKEVLLTNNIFDGINYNFTSFYKDCILFDFLGVDTVSITNNIIKNINYNALFEPAPGLVLGTLFAIFSFSGIEELKFFYNSVYIPKNEVNGFLSLNSILRGIVLIDNQNADFKNNIFALLQGNKLGETTNSTAYIYSIPADFNTTNFQSDNNIYIVANHTNNYFYSTGIGDNYDFAQWKTNYPGLDQNSYWEMPNVVSPDDLHLTQDCNRGTPIAEVPLDFEGTIRSTTSPDIGAYELISELNFVTGGNCQLTLIPFDIINGQNIQSALWNFGDSQTSTEIEPTHTYTNAGTYSVTLTVTFNDNTTKTISKEITIYEKPYKSNILHD